MPSNPRSTLAEPVAVDPAATLPWRLLDAVTAAEVARVILTTPGLGDSRTRVAWTVSAAGIAAGLGPGGQPLPGAQAEALLAAAAGRPAGIRVLHDDGEHPLAVMADPPPQLADGHPDLQAAATRMGEVLSMQRLAASVQQMEQSELLQRSLYAIADMAGSNLDMPDMLRGLHRIISGLMYAENFYIALYHPGREVLDFLYFVDTVDPDALASGTEVELPRIERGLTWHLVKGGRPLMGSLDEIEAQVDGALNRHGADCETWLGVPMLRGGEVRGALVVQSYLPGATYTETEQSLLGFVAEHVLTALERKQGQAELERAVTERTAQLAQANAELRSEITERQRGEHLQSVLYRIAALAGSEDSSERFYAAIHESIAELLEARNIFIALVSEDGEEISFAYVRDDRDPDWRPRRRGRGMTEYVLRTGEPQLVDRRGAEALLAAGELEHSMIGSPTRQWLGVPLAGRNRVLGVLAVQDYEREDRYGPREVELLTFVGHQVASTLQRRQAAEALRRANEDLERRVELRTAELREQIAVRERIEADLKHRVMHDALTGLPNRGYLRDQLERSLARYGRDPSMRVALLYVDIDRFKVINDSLGHIAGDEVLQEAARRMKACVRQPDMVARLAGDEFAMLIQDAQMPEAASKVARRLLRMLEPPVTAGGRQLQLSASVGIAVVDARYSSVDQVLHDADLALYRAKEGGRNRFVMFDEVMQRNAMEVLDLEQGLRDALARDEFEPWFQPLVRLDTGRRVGFEALLRWNHPQRGVLAPGAFLQVAEDSGLIEPIDWKMFELTMRRGRDLVEAGQYITINASPRLIQSPDFDRRLTALVQACDFDPARLRVEVTEGTLLHDPDAMVAMLARLADAGIHAALDDFGTGYSSLGHVHRFPLRMIKIDRSFVMPFEEGVANPRSSAVVEAIVALGRALEMEILAEGIETPAQREALQRLGCEFGQGYGFARPAPARHWLASTATTAPG